MSVSAKSYEAAVKLNTGQVVVYHNINTGLFKFHMFICEKFSSEQKWIYYKVRRKKDKTIVGFYRNKVEKKSVLCTKIYFEKLVSNESKTGFFFPLNLERNGYEIKRNVFISTKFLVGEGGDFIIIPNRLYDKIVNQAINDLYQYYLEQSHQIQLNEIQLGKMNIEKIEILRPGTEAESPQINYP